MSEEFFEDLEDDTYETISMISEDGTIIECCVIDGVLIDNCQYLLVVDSEEFDKNEPEAFLIKQLKDEGEEVIYAPVEDEAEYNKALILLQENETDYEMKF